MKDKFASMLTHEALQKKVSSTAVSVTAGIVIIVALLAIDYALNKDEFGNSPADTK